jgi:hypothetical protein
MLLFNQALIITTDFYDFRLNIRGLVEYKRKKASILIVAETSCVKMGL